MIDYREIWKSINSESSAATSKTQIARKIPTNGIFAIFLATDFNKGVRLLYIKLANDHNFLIDKLPLFRGLEITLSVTSIGGFVNQEFLKFSQSIPNSEKIFEYVISDLCDKVASIQDANKLLSNLTSVLNEWKLFFEKQQYKILSISEQKGLMGELFFLKDYLFRKYPYSEALIYWTGLDKTNHDFQLKDIAIEVKATSSKQHKKFYISSERQLDSTGLKHLYLAVFSLNVHDNMCEKSLPKFIEEIYLQIQDDSYATFQLEIKLAKYGYNQIHAEKYTSGFSLYEMSFFEVVSGFPRLLQGELPAGLGDLKYSIVVSACKPYQIESDIINIL